MCKKKGSIISVRYRDKSVPLVTVWYHSTEPRDAKAVTFGTDLSVLMSDIYIVAIRPARILKIGQRITFLWPKLILNRDFALAREILHDHKFSFYV